MPSTEPIAGPPSPPAIRNIHGRRPGRGLRPYLIVPKILGAASLFGGLACALTAVLLAPEPAALSDWRRELATLHRIFAFVVLPGLGIATVSGMLLLASIWQAMIRMRWFVTKMVLLAAGLPALHIFSRSRMQAMAQLLAENAPDLQQASALRHQLTLATAAALVFTVLVIVLGRIKPRLGQDYGRTFARSSRARP